MRSVQSSKNFRFWLHLATSEVMSLSGLTCLVGTLYLFYLSLKFLRVILNVVKSTLFGGSIDLTRFGDWAVVTGSTDGIGKSYAKQLAGKGLNIVLMSRNQEKLEAVASEIEKEYKVQTKIIQVDFSGGHEIYDDIPKKLEGLEIGILVNNVGVSVDHPEYFAEIKVESIWKMVNVNVLAVTMLTRLILPAMVERKKGVIINVASVAGAIFTPLLAEYGATKVYMDRFSANLELEYADKGIIVQSVLPAMVATNLSGIKKTSLSIPSPDDYVRAVLKKVGVANKCFGYWPHEIQAFLYTSVPDWLLCKLVFSELGRMRAKALKKKKSS